MSILIKGMEMPESEYVDVRLFADGRATTATGEYPFYKIMPLVELPPHGRLIDADALLKKAYDSGQYANAEEGFHQRVVDVEDIDDAPIIIGAERVE